MKLWHGGALLLAVFTLVLLGHVALANSGETPPAATAPEKLLMIQDDLFVKPGGGRPMDQPDYESAFLEWSCPTRPGHGTLKPGKSGELGDDLLLRLSILKGRAKVNDALRPVHEARFMQSDTKYYSVTRQKNDTFVWKAVGQPTLVACKHEDKCEGPHGIPPEMMQKVKLKVCFKTDCKDADFVEVAELEIRGS